MLGFCSSQRKAVCHELPKNIRRNSLVTKEDEQDEEFTDITAQTPREKVAGTGEDLPKELLEVTEH